MPVKGRDGRDISADTAGTKMKEKDTTVVTNGDQFDSSCSVQA